MRVYLSGGMSGYPDFNFPAFHERAAEWRREGWEVLSPAETFDGRTDLSRATYMRRDIELVLLADAIAVLPDWQRSTGASLEVSIAREIGLPVYDAGTFAPYEESALQEAQRLVHGSRRASYGHPLDDYTRTAALWSAILGIDITPEHAILCMIGVKLSRECHKPHRDNRVDAAGYAECLDMAHAERVRRAVVHQQIDANLARAFARLRNDDHAPVLTDRDPGDENPESHDAIRTTEKL